MKIINYILDSIYSLYFNVIVFDWKTAKKIPVKISHKVKIKGQLKRGCVKLNFVPTKYCIKIGYNGAYFIPNYDSTFHIGNKGRLNFNGPAVIAEGTNIFIDCGILSLGKNFYANRNMIIQCCKSISIGANCLMGWNVCIRDTDGHTLVSQNDQYAPEAEAVIIGDNTWIAADVTILKSTELPRGSIIGCNTLLTGSKFFEPHCLIAGIPGKILRHNISRKS